VKAEVRGLATPDSEDDITNTSESIRWAKVPIAITDAGLTLRELHAFIRLSGYAEGQSRLAWPSAETIGNDLHVSRRRARDLLNAIERKGASRKVGRRPGGGSIVWEVAPFPLPSDGVLSNANGDGRKTGKRWRERDPSGGRTGDALNRSTRGTDVGGWEDEKLDQGPVPDIKPEDLPHFGQMLSKGWS
jgi:hypothetical protein